MEPKSEFDQNLLLDPIAAARRASDIGFRAVGRRRGFRRHGGVGVRPRRPLAAVKNRSRIPLRVRPHCARRVKRAGRRYGGESSWRANAPDHSDAVVTSIELADAMASLSRMQRSAVLLCDGYDYSLAEAAAVLNCSVSTLRNHRNRGLKRLRQSMRATKAVPMDERELLTRDQGLRAGVEPCRRSAPPRDRTAEDIGSMSPAPTMPNRLRRSVLVTVVLVIVLAAGAIAALVTVDRSSTPRPAAPSVAFRAIHIGGRNGRTASRRRLVACTGGAVSTDREALLSFGPDTKLVVWGGATGKEPRPLRADGAAYNPSTHAWRVSALRPCRHAFKQAAGVDGNRARHLGRLRQRQQAHLPRHGRRRGVHSGHEYLADAAHCSDLGSSRARRSVDRIRSSTARWPTGDQHSQPPELLRRRGVQPRNPDLATHRRSRRAEPRSRHLATRQSIGAPTGCSRGRSGKRPARPRLRRTESERCGHLHVRRDRQPLEGPGGRTGALANPQEVLWTGKYALRARPDRAELPG